jgi:polar amino acid transport system substrate-binding protein
MRLVFALLALSLAAFAAGCGSSGSDNTTSSTTASSTTTGSAGSPASLVPAKLKAKGELTLGTDPTYPPMESVASDGKTIEGADVDLANAFFKELGLKVHIVKASFDGIIPGLKNSAKYDVAMSSMTDNKEREAVVDFVTYFSAGTSFYVKSGGPTINALADLCGHSVGVERGTTQESASKEQSAKCRKGGKPGVTVNSYPDQNAANLSVSSGRSEVGMADSPVVALIVKQSNGKFTSTGSSFDTAPYGIALPKDSGLAPALLAAVKKSMADGTYAAVLKKWGISPGAISDPKINGAVS